MLHQRTLDPIESLPFRCRVKDRGQKFQVRAGIRTKQPRSLRMWQLRGSSVASVDGACVEACDLLLDEHAIGKQVT